MKNVALALASGGARGLAHIGAIEILEERGYTITSIAGSSMGAMIAGMYASGRLKEAKEWFLTVNRQTIYKMADVSLTFNSMVKGDRIIEELQTIVPDCLLEQIPIPCTVVASDILSADEIIFNKGSMFKAIRASISIPLFFEPVTIGKHLLIDGGILNPLPLNRVMRTPGDLLCGVNISAQDKMTLKRYKIAHFNFRKPLGAASMTDRMTDMMIEQNSKLMIELTHPDILAEIPQYAFSTFDFDKAQEIIDAGRTAMCIAIDRHEATLEE